MIKNIEKFLIKTLAKNHLVKLVDLFLHFSLKLKGYKNFGNFDETGETYLINLLKKNKIKYCLDIGAHNGEYSKKLLNINVLKVIAFEPMKVSFGKLRKLKKLYPNNFECFNFALSNQNGFKKIYFTNKNSQLASLIKNLKEINFLKKKKIYNQKVKTIPLDFFVKQNKKLFTKKIDFVKIDTEGNDLNVIRGGFKFFRKHNPKFIQIEMNYHNLFSGDNLYQFKKVLNKYNIYRLLPYNNGLLKIDPTRPENNIFHLSNYIFIRN